MAFFEVRNLRLHYPLENGWVKAVDDVSFTLNHGQTMGLVGESGSGKTSIALSIMKLFPGKSHVEGQILLDGLDLLELTSDEIRKIRWKRISMIFQAAMNALNPVLKVGAQLTDALRIHQRIGKSDAQKIVLELFQLVGLSSSSMGKYPHELSGGMKQRVMIAMSLLYHPDIIIADEPTTALDVVVQDLILQEIEDLQKKIDFAMILITHNISIVAETCENIAVMYGGKIFEHASSAEIFKNPKNPYTKGLLEAFPSISGPRRELVSIPGAPPDLVNPSRGCRFEPRCPLAQDICVLEDPRLVEVGNNHFCRCHFASTV